MTISLFTAIVSLDENSPDGFADACVTDPPYKRGFSYSTDDDNKSATEYEEWCTLRFAGLRRVVSGPIVLSPGYKNVGVWCRINEPDWIMS